MYLLSPLGSIKVRLREILLPILLFNDFVINFFERIMNILYKNVYNVTSVAVLLVSY